MEVYPPSMLTPDESKRAIARPPTQPVPPPVTDEAITKYVECYFKAYRETVDRFFSRQCPFLSTYVNHPYHTSVLRMGTAGFIIGHTPSPVARVTIMGPQDFDPPLAEFNLFDIVKRWGASLASFDLSGDHSYTEEEARLEATQLALTDALRVFWAALPKEGFERICRQLLAFEGFSLEPDKDELHDAIGDVTLAEPAGFRRVETWGFEFKHYAQDRLSAHELRQIERSLNNNPIELPDIVCFLTSGDLTSVGNAIAVTNRWIRVWDRHVLNRLVNKHLEAIAPYFPEYQVAAVSTRRGSGLPLSQSFRLKLQQCPPGHAAFSQFEELGTMLLTDLFSPHIGEARVQRTTRDRTQRRDVLFRNYQTTSFWQRVGGKYDADFVIVDFKNNAGRIGADEVWDAARYPNAAVGRFILIVSREGPDNSVEAVQLRILRDNKTAILVVNDAQMIEMATRHERGERPEDVLDDLLDELLLRY